MDSYNPPDLSLQRRLRTQGNLLSRILNQNIKQRKLAYLRHRTIFLNQQRGIVVDGDRLRVVMAKAAEEGLEDAAVPGLLGRRRVLSTCRGTQVSQPSGRTAGLESQNSITES